MASTFVNNLQAMIVDLAGRDPGKMLHMFNKRSNDPAVLRAFYASRPGLMSDSSYRAIEGIRNSGQTVNVEYYNKIAPGAGATRVRQGTGGGVTANIVPTYFTPIQEGFDTSLVANAVRQYVGNGMDPRDAIKKAYEDDLMELFAQKIRNIYTRADQQFAAYLEAQHWPLVTQADAGTQYTTYTGDAKNIPLADFTNKQIIQKLEVEAMQNNFLQFGRPLVIGSATTKRIVQTYSESGVNNSTNVAQYLPFFEPYFTNEIADSTTPAHLATFFMMPFGAVGGYSRTFDYGDLHPKGENGVVNMGNDSWTTIEVGGEDSLLFSDLPRIKVEVKGYGGYADNSGSLTIDESRTDIVENVSLVAQFGAEKAPSVANTSSIIKHVLLAS